MGGSDQNIEEGKIARRGCLCTKGCDCCLLVASLKSSILVDHSLTSGQPASPLDDDSGFGSDEEILDITKTEVNFPYFM